MQEDNAHLMQNIFGCAQNSICLILSSNHEIQWLNDVAKKIFGNHAIGENCINVCEKLNIFSALREKLLKISLKKAIGNFHEKYDYEEKSDTVNWILALTVKDGQLKEIIAVGEMLIERVSNKAEPLDQQDYLNSVVDIIPSSVYWKNENGVYLGCNQAMVIKSNLKSKKDIIGKTDFDLWAEYADRLNKMDKEVIRTKKTLEKEEAVQIHTGEMLYFTSIKAPFVVNNKIGGVVGTSIDITANKKAEKLQKEKEIVSEKLALTEEFAGFLAHELRTPIAALNLDLDTIAGNEENQNAEEKQNNLYQIIAKGKQTIKEANIFIDMLLLKLRSMGKKVKQEDLNPCLILEDVSDALELYPFTETERTKVILDEKGAFIYLGDSLHTQHITLNLLKNALKIIREEGKGEIHITFEQGENCNKLIFTDTAKGISQEFLPSIFDAFITKDATKKGTGLGLAYCKIIMHGYGGDITCESKLGEYTKFILTFPKINIADLD